MRIYPMVPKLQIFKVILLKFEYTIRSQWLYSFSFPNISSRPITFSNFFFKKVGLFPAFLIYFRLFNTVDNKQVNKQMFNK